MEKNYRIKKGRGPVKADGKLRWEGDAVPFYQNLLDSGTIEEVPAEKPAIPKSRKRRLKK